LFVTGVVNLNISGNNISGEGLNFWILKVSPVSTKKLLQIKIIFSSIIGILCGIIMMIVFYFVLKPGLSFLVLGFFLLILFNWGQSTIGTSIGVFFPVFKSSQPNRGNISFLGGLLIFVFFIIYLMCFGSIAIGGLFIGSFLSWPNLVIFPVILILEFAVNLILYKILVNISTYRLNKLEWEY